MHRGRILAARLPAIVAAVLLALYPVVVYFGVRRLDASWLALLLIALFALRLVTFRWGSSWRPTTSQLALVCVGGIALALLSLVQRRLDAMLYYPVLVNGVLLTVFAWSLVRPPTVVERIARFREGDLPPEAVVYTRRVTIAWVVFFVVNGGVALYTARATSLETWAFYNGVVAYVLIGIMFGAEWLVRRRVGRSVPK